MIYINRKIIRYISAGIILSGVLGGIFPVTESAAAGGITINEVCPENTFCKAPDGGVYAWAELYNSSSGSVDISGWGFSDDPSDLRKYTLPAGTVIQSGERKLIYCTPESTITNIAGDENII
ncbi:MAG: lamin tail domain-containing protein, partial [Ruminococcus sp.]|nr:lamin tail domain-containing protein [Ruminococcus sp.]